MCGRFVLKAPVTEIKEWFGTASALPEAGPRYNVKSRLPISCVAPGADLPFQG
jgi:hypothetical protein